MRFQANLDDIYPPEVMHRASALHAQGFDRLHERLHASNRPNLEGQALNLHLDVHLETSSSQTTAHFEAGEHPTGYASLSSDGTELARVRCWSTNDAEPDRSLEPHDRIKGGTVKRIPAPDGLCSRTLRNAKTRTVRFGRETVLGLGTTHGTVWLRGTADAEALLKVAHKLRTARAR